MNMLRTKSIEQTIREGDEPEYQLKRTLSALDLTVFGVGVVIGAGIFTLTGRAAQEVAGPAVVISFVIAATACALAALCYAELAAAWPHAGGDYHFLQRAYGRRVAFLFAWARFSVITTGSIALLAFVFGDYMSAVLPLGAYSSALWGALAVLTCPCHLPILAVVLAGTTAGAFIGEHWGIAALTLTGLFILSVTRLLRAFRGGS